MPQIALIVMSRAPVPGETKTRLIPVLGAEGAVRFHAACLSDLLDEAEAWRGELVQQDASLALVLSITPAKSEGAFRTAGVVIPPSATVAAQRGESLGERMASALQDGLAQGECVLLTGCDLPLLTRAHWEAALRALEHHEAVLGPSADGGYYLVGVRRGIRAGWEGLLHIDAWGTETVLDLTLKRAKDLGVDVTQIAKLPDVDTSEDAQRVLAHPLAKILAKRRGVALLHERFGP